MEKHPENYHHPENDVDFTAFFGMIAKGFKAVFQFIKSVFLFIFNVLVEKPYLFFYKNRKILIPVFVILMIFAVILDSMKTEMYKGEMLISPNYNSGKELYNRVEFINSLIADEDYKDLAALFSLPVDTVKKLESIEIEPNFNKRIDLKYFSEFIRFLDTAVVDNADFDEFSNSFKDQKFDYPQHIITLISASPSVFPAFNRYFDTLLEKNEKFVYEKEHFLKNQQFALNQYQKALQQIDSLRETVNYAIKNLSKQSGNLPSESVIVGSGRIEFPEEKYNLFEIRREILQNIASIQKDLIDQREILKVDAFFPEKGEIFEPLSRKYKVSFLIGFWLLLIIIAIIIDVLAYLNKKYQL